MSKFIKIPNTLIDQKDIDPATTFLYVILKSTYDYKSNTTLIRTKTLMERLNWRNLRTLKKHIQKLKDNGYINYDFVNMPKSGYLEIFHPVIQKNYTQLNIETIYSMLDNRTFDRKDVLIRLYLLYKCYFHTDYEYCWLSYEDIKQRMKIGYSTISLLNDTLHDLNYIQVLKGTSKMNHDSTGFYKERNKYKIL